MRLNQHLGPSAWRPWCASGLIQGLILLHIINHMISVARYKFERDNGSVSS